MSYTKILIHAVWGTKNRVHYLTPEVRKIVIDHIKENAKKKGIFIDRINGYVEHMHCLLYLNADMSIGKAMNLIKGESSRWINKNKIMPIHFEWADEYYAASVSESAKNVVRRYIDNQEQHHAKTSFEVEYQKFISDLENPGE